MSEFTVYAVALFVLRVYQSRLEEKAIPPYLRGAFTVKYAHHRRLPRVLIVR